MSQLFINIIAGLVVVIIAALLGIGGTTKVVVHGNRSGKAGKWIIIISVVMILSGLFVLGKNPTPTAGIDFNNPGTLLIGYGIIFFIVGRIVAWYQRL